MPKPKSKPKAAPKSKLPDPPPIKHVLYTDGLPFPAAKLETDIDGRPMAAKQVTLWGYDDNTRLVFCAANAELDASGALVVHLNSSNDVPYVLAAGSFNASRIERVKHLYR